MSTQTDDTAVMETTGGAAAVQPLELKEEHSAPSPDVGTNQTKAEPDAQTKEKEALKVNRKVKHAKSKKKKKREVPVESSSEDSSSDSDSDSDSENSGDDSSEDERRGRKEKKKAAKKKAEKKKAQKKKEKAEKKKADKKKAKKKAKAKAKAKKKKSKNHNASSDDSNSSDSSDSDSSSSSSDSDSESETETKKAKKPAKDMKPPIPVSVPPPTTDFASTATAVATLAHTAIEEEEADALFMKKLAHQLQDMMSTSELTKLAALRKEMENKGKKGEVKYKRVDQAYDEKIRDWTITDTAEKKSGEVDCVFSVRRKFNWEGKYNCTLVDIKSTFLKDALKEVLKHVKSISLDEEKPTLDPNLIFLFYDEIKEYYKKTLKARLKKEKKKKQKKHLTRKIAECKLLAAYIDEDYEDTRKRLIPMLKAGNVTFDLMWALWKPNTIVYEATYGNKDDPRCFKVDTATLMHNWMQEEWWSVEGRYLQYDGKVFGHAEKTTTIDSFKRPRKITSFDIYPLSYYSDPEGLTKELIERGKKFVALEGRHYRYQKGLAYQKHKRTVLKHAIDGRVMVDPALFRRINPNYPAAYISHENELNQDDSDSDSGCGSHCDSDSDDEKVRHVFRKDKNGKWHNVAIPAGSSVADITSQKLEPFDDEEGSTHIFTDEELLIASPVVLGFSFSVKAWLEFSLTGLKEIEWNADAFDSLVLPAHIKQNLRGLVSSHRFNEAKTVDDVIQGKGKGLNVVLHGPPGVGKTLTGESIADFLKCPLYAVSAGELGTNSNTLEADLNRIMDITHSWGAILLLDEADVFLEQRQAQDIHRNALVSVFLRLLEYYQGILFLTTNRIETFDEAVQSRIHMGIKYNNLTNKARREIWTVHIRKIQALENQKSEPFTQDDFDHLSRKEMNGRQIKNTVKMAHSTSLADEKPFSLEYVKRSLRVAEEFTADMRGGAPVEVLYS